METHTSTLSNCKESVVEDEVTQWLTISEYVEKAKAIAKKKAEAQAEAQAIIDWYNFHSTPGAQMYYRQYLEEQEIIALSVKVVEYQLQPMAAAAAVLAIMAMGNQAVLVVVVTHRHREVVLQQVLAQDTLEVLSISMEMQGALQLLLILVVEVEQLKQPIIQTEDKE